MKPVVVPMQAGATDRSRLLRVAATTGLLVACGLLEAVADGEQGAGGIRVLLDDVLEQRERHRVVLHQGRLGAESVAEAQVTARVEHQVVGEHHVRGAVEDAHDAELLAVLFHVAEAQAVGAGRPSRDFVHLAVGALERRGAGGEVAEVAFETTVVHQGVSHMGRVKGSEKSCPVAAEITTPGGWPAWRGVNPPALTPARAAPPCRSRSCRRCR